MHVYYNILQANSTIRLNNKMRTYNLRKKLIYHSVLDLFPLTYMCVDIDFYVFSDEEAEKNPLRHKLKICVVVITFVFLNFGAGTQ